MANKTLLITGANGFIGSYLAEYGQTAGFTVIGVDQAEVSVCAHITYYKMNLLENQLLPVLLKYKPEIIVHCAGTADVNMSVSKPDLDFTFNTLLTRKLLYDIDQAGIFPKIVVFSSAAVYGNPQSLPITEDTPLNPMSPYGLHKLLVEEICGFFSKQMGHNICILRVFSAYGSGLRKQIMWDMWNKFNSTGMISLSGTGDESRDFIHVMDLVRTVFLLIDSDHSGYEVYNVGNGVEVSIYDCACTFARAVGENDSIVHFDGVQRPGNPRNWRADISRLKELGYEQTISFENGVKGYVQWVKDLK